MRLTRRYLALLLVLLLLCVGALSGCGGKEESAAQNEATSAPTETETQTLPDDNEIVSGLIGKGQLVKEMAYDYVIVGGGASSESKVWLKDQKMKMEGTFNGPKMTFIFDKSKKEFITYTSGQNSAIKMTLSEYNGPDTTTPVDYVSGLVESKYTIGGTETVNGMECKVLTFTSEGSTVKEWISTEYGIVVKAQYEAGGEMTTMEFKNLQIGTGAVPAGTFDLPSGMEVVDINGIMNLDSNK